MKKNFLKFIGFLFVCLITEAQIKEGDAKNKDMIDRRVKREMDKKDINTDGMQTFYDKDGRIVEKTQYYHGKKNGMSYLYDKNGVVSEIRFYYDNELLGNVEKEEVDIAKINGVFYGVHHIRSKILAPEILESTIYETPLQKGIPNGVGMAVLDFQISSPRQTKEKQVLFYENGRLKQLEMIYTNGSRKKKEYTYESNNYLVKEDFITKDFQSKIELDSNDNGNARYYYPDGRLMSTTNVENNKNEGEFLVYYPNGKLQEKGVNVEGKRSGIWKIFAEDGSIDGIEFYEKNIFCGELVLRDEIKDLENGDFVIRKSSNSGLSQARFSLKDGYLDGVMKVHIDGVLIKELPYKQHKLHGVAKEYINSAPVLRLYNEGLYIGDVDESFDDGDFDGKMSLKNQDGSRSVAEFENGFVKELRIYNQDKLLKEIKRDGSEYIERIYKDGESSETRIKNKITQIFKNKKKNKEIYDLFFLGDIKKEYKEGKLEEIKVSFMGRKFHIKQNFEKEPNGVLVSENDGDRLEIALLDGVPNGRLKVANKNGEKEIDLEFVNGVVNGKYTLLNKKEKLQCDFSFDNNKIIQGECQEGGKQSFRIVDEDIVLWLKKSKGIHKSVGTIKTATFLVMEREGGKKEARIEDLNFEVEGVIYKRIKNYNDFTGELMALGQSTIQSIPIKKGIVEGISKIYYPLYGLIGKDSYKNDMLNGIAERYLSEGIQKIFYTNGLKTRVQSYKNNQLFVEEDIQAGEIKRFENGKLKEIEKSPIQRLYYPEMLEEEARIFGYDNQGNLQSVEFRGNKLYGEEIKIADKNLLQKGSLNGVYRYRDQFGNRRENTYKNSLKDGIARQYQDIDGISYLILEANYKEGRRNGKSKKFDPKEGRRQVQEFWNDMLHGYTITYDASGGIEEMALFNLDKLIAIIDKDTIKKFSTRKIRLYKNGALKTEAELRDGELYGSIKHYDDKGHLISEIDCSNNKCFVPKIKE